MNRGTADEIIRRIANRRRNSDLRADDREIRQALNDAFTRLEAEILLLRATGPAEAAAILAGPVTPPGLRPAPAPESAPLIVTQDDADFDPRRPVAYKSIP